MSAKILDGKALASQLKSELASQIQKLEKKHHRKPHLVSVLFGEDAAALSYAISQQKTAESLGIRYELMKLDHRTTPLQFLELMKPYRDDPDFHGVFFNKPIPSQLKDDLDIAIGSDKDIEGMHPVHVADLFLGQSYITPCTPAAALALLKSSGVNLAGQKAVVVGRSEIVGKPMALLLLKENMTVTICHSKTRDLKEELSRADVIIAAIGKPLFIKGDWIKPGAIVIDVGINEKDGKIVGDVDFDSCKDKAAFISPVPGGVGPVTSVMLMKNLVELYQRPLKDR
jgi:methylenetetrahydrofolate dehydrogenase (NADP+) / methenyltetrahydrofolate cyclohydrolase